MIAPQEVQSLLTAAFKDGQISVFDLTGTQDHYKVIIISNDFDGKNLVKRHQLVNAALAEPLKGPLHALTIEALTPKELKERESAANQEPKGIEF